MSDQRIQQRPTGVVQTSTQAPAGFGGGEEGVEIANAGLNAAKMVKDHADEQLARANNLWFMKTETEISKKQLELEAEAKKKKGYNAFGLAESTEQDLDTFADGIQTNNQAQKDALIQIKTARKNSMNRTVTGYVNSEIEKVQIMESEASRINSTESAAAHYDTEDYELDKLKFEKVVDDEIGRLGLKPEATKAFRLEETTKFHIAVINARLDDLDNPELSVKKRKALQIDTKAYLKKYDAEISQAVKDKMLPAIEAGDVKADSLSISDDVISKHGSFSKQKEAVKKMKLNAATEDAVMTRLRRNSSDNDLAAREESEANEIDRLNTIKTAATEAAKNGENVSAEDVLGVSAWSKLNLNERIRMRNHAASVSYSNNPKVLAQREASKTATVERLWNLWLNDKKGFMGETTGHWVTDANTGGRTWVASELNLASIKSQIGETDYNRFKRFQESIIGESRKGVVDNEKKVEKDKLKTLDDMMSENMKKFDIVFSSELMSEQAFDYESADNTKEIKLAQIRGRKFLKSYFDKNFYNLPEKDQTVDKFKEVADQAWLNTDVQRSGIYWDDTEELYGDGTLPLFISERLAEAENLTGVLDDSGVSSFEFSSDAKAHFKEKYGIPANSKYDLKTKSFTVTGDNLKSYLKFPREGLPNGEKTYSLTSGGRKLTLVYVGLDGFYKQAEAEGATDFRPKPSRRKNYMGNWAGLGGER